MEQGLIFSIFGVIASVSMVLGYLPQAIETIRTRNTEGIALPTFLMMALGSFAFMIQGLIHKPDILWSLFLTNLIPRYAVVLSSASRSITIISRRNKVSCQLQLSHDDCARPSSIEEGR